MNPHIILNSLSNLTTGVKQSNNNELYNEMDHSMDGQGLPQALDEFTAPSVVTVAEQILTQLQEAA